MQRYIHVSFYAALLLCGIGVLLPACSSESAGEPNDNTNYAGKLTHIPAEQQAAGNAQAGREYLLSGRYIGSGIPLDVYFDFFAPDESNPLGREGNNARLPYYFSAVQAPNGVTVVSQNCLVCHAQTLNGALIVGLGNSVQDFTANSASILPFLSAHISDKHGAASPEMAAFSPFARAVSAFGPHIRTAVRGVNPADKLTWILAAHRDPHTLEWRATPDPALPAADVLIPSDVPAWWLLKKKNAMFYSGIGRGDFTGMLMAASILSLQDSSEAASIHAHFDDVLAFIYTLEAPQYPLPVDAALAAEGRLIFEMHCSDCHGSYGAAPAYPNVLVHHELIGTDRALADSYSGMFAAHVQKFNDSWFGSGGIGVRITPGNGYVAPPLDGVWATAPYLHNGSVPTIYDMLNSKGRPATWKRSFNTSDYDFTKLGWEYTREHSAGNTEIYDTSLPGYGNQGHTFGDKLSEAERFAVLEYLKTL